jgi:hypothetical protein
MQTQSGLLPGFRLLASLIVLTYHIQKLVLPSCGVVILCLVNLLHECIFISMYHKTFLVTQLLSDCYRLTFVLRQCCAWDFCVKSTCMTHHHTYFVFFLNVADSCTYRDCSVSKVQANRPASACPFTGRSCGGRQYLLQEPRVHLRSEHAQSTGWSKCRTSRSRTFWLLQFGDLWSY